MSEALTLQSYLFIRDSLSSTSEESRRSKCCSINLAFPTYRYVSSIHKLIKNEGMTLTFPAQPGTGTFIFLPTKSN